MSDTAYVSAAELCDLFADCSRAVTDSRRIVDESMFFALRGPSFDGNEFAAEALAKGARYAVVDSDKPLGRHPELAGRLLRVGNVLEALQQVAREHRRRLAIPIIAIAGSNGKTTTKELTAAVLAERYAVTATQGNLNNHIGVPLTLLSMTRETEFGVVEMGASACGEIALLASIAEPNYGILTNIGRSHLEGFGGVEGIRRGKGELYDFLERNGGTAFVPRENGVLAEMAAERSDMAAEYYSVRLADGIRSRLEGEYNRANMAAAVAVGTYFGVPHERIASAIAEYVPTNNRSQCVESGRNTIVVDCYNANPSSMTVALDSIRTGGEEPVLLILGDMLELGRWSREEHTGIARAAVATGCAGIITVGGDFAEAFAAIAGEIQGPDIKSFATTDQALQHLTENPVSGMRILLKGSRRWGLEKLLAAL